MAMNADSAAEKQQYGNEQDVEALRAQKYGNRIDKPRTRSIVAGADDASDTSVSVGKQMELESTNSIKYRTCSWQKTAALLFSEYICLAIMSFPYSYAILGLVPGLIMTVVVAALVLYTSLIVWCVYLNTDTLLVHMLIFELQGILHATSRGQGRV